MGNIANCCMAAEEGNAGKRNSKNANVVASVNSVDKVKEE